LLTLHFGISGSVATVGCVDDVCCQNHEVAIVIAFWFAFYFMVFLPRGSVQ